MFNWYHLMDYMLQLLVCLQLGIVWPMGPGKLPAVWVQTAKTSLFCYRPVQRPDPHLLRGPNPDPYRLTCRLCWVWLDQSVPVTSSGHWVILFMFALRHPTVSRNILALVRHCPFSIRWLHFYSGQRDTCSHPIPEDESQWSVIDFSSCILGNLSGDWLPTFPNRV